MSEGESEKSAEPDGASDNMTFWEHLDELRGRLIKVMIAVVLGAAVAWIFRESILALMVEPYKTAWIEEGIPGEPKLHFATPTAAFLAYVKLAVFGGFIAALPIVLYQFWAFVAPGLYSKEKRLAVPFVVSSLALFCGGAYFGWKLAFGQAFGFLLGLGGNLGDAGLEVQPTVMMGDYITFVTKLLIAFGAVFELPILILFLSLVGLVDHRKLIKFARYFVVVAFILAAILSPPDIASQLLIAVPLCVLYVLSIGLSFVVTRSRERGQADPPSE